MKPVPGGHDLRALTTAASVSAAVMMGYFIASRAARDTLFFVADIDIALLPIMNAGAAALSVLISLYTANAMASAGPRRLVPLAFLGSALWTAMEWPLVVRQPVLATLAVYVHVGVVSPVLVSGFWSLLNEGLDPRATRTAVGRIAGFATLGGLLGAILAERVTAGMGVATVFPALTLAHLWCAWSTWRLPIPPERSVPSAVLEPGAQAPEGPRLLLDHPHLRNLALITFGVSISSVLIDLLFRAYAGGQSNQELPLMRTFLGLNAAIAIGTFAMQLLIARLKVGPDGIVRAIGTVPGTLALGGAIATVFPGPWTVSILRTAEGVLRASVFRTGYELLYSALPRAQRRAVRTVIDVGCDRTGEIVGSAITAFVLLSMPVASSTILLALCGIVALATLFVVLRLRSGHLSSLAGLLRDGVRDLDGATLSSLQFAMGGAVAADPVADPGGADDAAPAVASGERSASSPPRDRDRERERAAEMPPSGGSLDRPDGRFAVAPLTDSIAVAQGIHLLADEAVAGEALDALMAVAGRHVGQLTDALLDPDTATPARLRITALLASCPIPRAVEGLTRGLADDQFEVRSACGRALARLVDRDGTLRVDRELIFGAVMRETVLSRQAWESQRAFARLEDSKGTDALVGFLRDRADRSLEHVFTLLALALPGERLLDAFRGLKTGDPMLRGAALEYLESVLPPSVREVLWPFL